MARDFAPFRLRPVGKYWLPVPNKINEMLESFDIPNSRNKCVLGGLNHATQKRRKSLTVNCTELASCHMFVQVACYPLAPQGGVEVCVEKMEIDRTRKVFLLLYNNSNPVAITMHQPS